MFIIKTPPYGASEHRTFSSGAKGSASPVGASSKDAGEQPESMLKSISISNIAGMRVRERSRFFHKL